MIPRLDRGWLLLVIGGMVAAWIYVQWSEIQRERDQLVQWAEVTCAAAGTPFAASTEQRVDTDGRQRTVTFATGQRCRTAVTTAVAFRTDTERTTAAMLAAAMRDRDAKTQTDATAARAAAEAARAATERMEIADAKAAPTNRVDGDWFAALNDVAGLRAPGR